MLCDFSYKGDSVLLSVSPATDASTNVNSEYLVLNSKYLPSKGSRTRCNRYDKSH